MGKTKTPKYPIPEYDPQTGEKNPYWDELTKDEKENGVTNPKGVEDLNKVSLDVLVDMLEGNYMYHSTSDAYGIMQLIEFYKKNK